MKLIALALSLFIATSASAAGNYPFTPDPKLTPGDVATTDKALVCQAGYPAKARKVSGSLRTKVYRLHGVDSKSCVGGCKIDHLIPLSVGGSNDIKNLWPHEYGAEWTVFMKTRLEVRLRKEVCQGRMPIQEAQECARNDWTKCFSRFYPNNVPKKEKQ